MKALFKLTDPEQVEASLTVTMTIRQWKELRSQLSTYFPSWLFGSMITAVIDKATAAFSETGEKE